MAAVVLAAATAARPNQVRTTLTSPAALVRIGALILGLVAWSFVVRRLVRARWVRAALLVLPAVALVALVVVPSFRTTRIDEALPLTSADLLGAPAAPAPSTVATAAPAPAASPGGTAQPAPPATPAGSTAPAAPATPPTLAAPAASPAAPAPKAPATAATTAPAAGAAPVTLSTGTLRGIGHRASGAARILRLADGTAFVRFDGISIESGPDYVVHLVPGADQRKPTGGIELGRLKAVEGSHSYAIPAGTDLSGPWTVLVWCRAFAVPVAAATQHPA